MNTPTTKVQYALRHECFRPACYLVSCSDMPSFTEKRADAETFDTVMEAAKRLATASKNDGNFTIVRLEHTPGTREVVITDRVKIDATKPCVIQGGRGFVGTDPLGPDDCDLKDAKQFSDLQEALLYIYDCGIHDPKALKVFNVEVREQPATITETVLA